MSVTPARRIACEILRRVETEGSYAADLLHAQLDKKLKREDAALTTELTLGVLRWKRLLDFLIERQANRPVIEMDLEVQLALRLGLYQLCFLTRVPARAAVNESVELVKHGRKGFAAGFVNATLRRIPARLLKTAEIARLLPPELSPGDCLGILQSHPTWLVERWLGRFGEERTRALLETNNRPPALACALPGPTPRKKVVASLEAQGLVVEPGRLLREAALLSGGSPSRTEAFRRGWISVQDEASQAVARLLGVREGETALDLCAAPGGKTILLARAAGPHGRVVAGDLHLHRLRAMQGQLERAEARNVLAVALDATRPLPFSGLFDRVLVDAPCSGTGTLARNPEIRWRLRPEDLPDHAGKQAALLASAAARLAPGGRLLYSTCSLEPEENEEIVARLLREAGQLRLVNPVASLAPYLLEGVAPTNLFDSAGFFRTFPPDSHTDGFFAAAFERCG